MIPEFANPKIRYTFLFSRVIHYLTSTPESDNCTMAVQQHSKQQKEKKKNVLKTPENFEKCEDQSSEYFLTESAPQ